MFKYALKRNVVTGKGSIRNLSDGTSCASVKHYVQAATGIMGDSVECYDSSEDYFTFYGKRDDITLLINSEDFWFGRVRTTNPVEGRVDDYNYDTIVILPSGDIHLYNAGEGSYSSTESLRSIYRASRKQESIRDTGTRYGVNGILNLLNDIPSITIGEIPDDERESITITAIDTDGNIYHPSRTDGRFGNWDYACQVVETNETPKIQSKQEDKPMNTIKTTATNVLAANKESAVNAAKIEAGGIVINRAVKLIKHKMPFGTASMIDSPIGRVALANVIALVVEQYAPRNEKAKLLSGAVMDAAMLQLVQSFNISALIDDLISGVDVSGFAKTEEVDQDNVTLDLTKYNK